MADPGDTVRHTVRFPRRKPLRLTTSIAHRSYKLARLLFPKRWLLRFLLESARLTRTLAWEHLWFSRPAEDALALSRPHTLKFLTSAVFDGASVIDLGGGSGVIAHALAPKAGRMVVVDSDSRNLSRARSICLGNANVEFLQGDIMDVLQGAEGFDVALLLHGLGYFDDPIHALRCIRKHARRLILEVPDFDADPLNSARVAESLPAWSDSLYVAEFNASGLADCLKAAGWSIQQLELRNGQLLAVADA
jgi:SAM-dependent methyltransferase